LIKSIYACSNHNFNSLYSDDELAELSTIAIFTEGYCVIFSDNTKKWVTNEQYLNYYKNIVPEKVTSFGGSSINPKY